MAAIANFVRPIFIFTMIILRQFDSFTLMQNGLPLLYNSFESSLAKIQQYKVIPFNPWRAIWTFLYFVDFKKKEMDPIFFCWNYWFDLMLVNIYDSLKWFRSFASRCMYIWKCIAGGQVKELNRAGTIPYRNVIMK